MKKYNNNKSIQSNKKKINKKSDNNINDNKLKIILERKNQSNKKILKCNKKVIYNYQLKDEW